MRTFLLTCLALDAILWIVLAVMPWRRGRARLLKGSLVYHVLSAGAIVMIVPFYWMLATSLKDFSSASHTPPTWLPLAIKYYAPSPTDPGKEIQVGLIRGGEKPWQEIRQMSEVVVAPVDQLNISRLHFKVAGSSLRRVRRPQWENYVDAWMGPAKADPANPITFSRYFVVSIVTAVVTTIGTLFTSMLAAYAFAKMRFVGKGAFFFIVLATMMVPGQVLLIPNFIILAALPDYTFGMQWLDNYPALIAPWLASVFSIFLLRQFFVNVPDELWDAAQIDGASRWRYLWQVILPLSKPVLISAGIFIFLGQWNSLLWPLIVTTSPDMRTLMVGLQTFNEELRQEYHLLMAASTIAIAPVVLMFFVLQRFFVQGIARAGIRS